MEGEIAVFYEMILEEESSKRDEEELCLMLRVQLSLKTGRCEQLTEPVWEQQCHLLAATREGTLEPLEPPDSHSDLSGPHGLSCVGEGRGNTASHEDTGGSWDRSDILCPKPGASGMT